MAKTLKRCVSTLKISSFSFLSFSSCPNFSLTYLNQCYKKTHFYQIHAHLITSNRFQNPFLISKLLKLSSHFEDLKYSENIFDKIDFPDVVCVNTLIKVYSNSYVPYKGVIFYFECVKNGLFFNSYTFPPLICCCAKTGRVSVGGMCHGQVIKNGFGGVLEIENSLIHMYVCCGFVEVGLRVFEGMVVRDFVSWNSVIDGFMRTGDSRFAHKLFDEMPERNVVSWNVMMTGYLYGNNPGCVVKLFREMVRGGLLGNGTTMVNVLAACGRSARSREGASVHGFLVRNLWNLSLIVNTALIDMYNKCQRVKVARRIFDRLREKNTVCWNSMILGHCLHGNPEDGLGLFEDMRSEGRLMLPDEITFVGVLCACTRAGKLASGKSYFHQMVNVFGIKPNFAHFWCMANLLASNGLVDEALETVRKANEFVPDTSSQSLVWASLLGSCRFEGDTTLAEQIAKALIQAEPQNIMCYALLLNIYAAGAKWDAAAEVKTLMKKKLAGNLTSCSLVDLIEIVHNFRVGNDEQCGTEIVTMVDALTGRLVSKTDQEPSSMSKIACRT